MHTTNKVFTQLSGGIKNKDSVRVQTLYIVLQQWKYLWLIGSATLGISCNFSLNLKICRDLFCDNEQKVDQKKPHVKSQEGISSVAQLSI